MIESLTLVGGLIAFGGLALFVLLMVAIRLRRVVSTNEVHIVQSAKKTTSYGKDTPNGNTYYEWPSFLPIFGLTKVVLPVSVFDLDLEDYEAYDDGRLPFRVDVKAFFQISDSNKAAQSVSNYQELLNQLRAIVQGAVRTILASNSIEEIMQGRSKFGEEFTKEVDGQLSNWGVKSVKNIELMDIRDAAGSQVIQNIMAKKKSQIDMESRTEVAKNKQAAEIAEIAAKREVDLQAQQAKQQVGLRTIETERQVSLSKEAAVQAIKEQERTTKEREMAVLQVQQVRTAEINRDTGLVKAEQERQVSVINADAKLETQKREAEGKLELTRRNAEGIALEGKAKADAERAMLLAPVEAQTTLAKEIGQNESYQKYLITIRKVEAEQMVGIEQARALTNAEVKVIANSGSPTGGVKSVMDLFSSNGGTQLGAMLEGLVNTDQGAALVSKVLGEEKKVAVTKPVTNGKGH